MKVENVRILRCLRIKKTFNLLKLLALAAVWISKFLVAQL